MKGGGGLQLQKMIYALLRSDQRTGWGDTRPVLFIDDRLVATVQGQKVEINRERREIGDYAIVSLYAFEREREKEEEARNGARGDCIPEYEKVCRE